MGNIAKYNLVGSAISARIVYNKEVQLTVTEENQIGVVSDIATSSTPVDDTSSGWGNLSKGVNVSYQC